jgi:hypothetical protein
MSVQAYAVYIQYKDILSGKTFRGFCHLTQTSQVGSLKQCREMKNRIDAGQSDYEKVQVIKLPAGVSVEDVEKIFDGVKS